MARRPISLILAVFTHFILDVVYSAEDAVCKDKAVVALVDRDDSQPDKGSYPFYADMFQEFNDENLTEYWIVYNFFDKPEPTPGEIREEFTAFLYLRSDPGETVSCRMRTILHACYFLDGGMAKDCLNSPQCDLECEGKFEPEKRLLLERLLDMPKLGVFSHFKFSLGTGCHAVTPIQPISHAFQLREFHDRKVKPFCSEWPSARNGGEPAGGTISQAIVLNRIVRFAVGSVATYVETDERGTTSEVQITCSPTSEWVPSTNTQLRAKRAIGANQADDEQGTNVTFGEESHELTTVYNYDGTPDQSDATMGHGYGRTEEFNRIAFQKQEHTPNPTDDRIADLNSEQKTDQNWDQTGHPKPANFKDLSHDYDTHDLLTPGGKFSPLTFTTAVLAALFLMAFAIWLLYRWIRKRIQSHTSESK